MQTARLMSVKELQLNDDNPRHIKDARFQKLIHNLQTYPKFLQLRPIVYDDKDGNKVLGGNMRLRGAVHLGWKEVPALPASELSAEEKEAFIILDNQDFGEWDYETLANNYEPHMLVALGFEPHDLGIKLGDPAFAVDEEEGEDASETPEGKFETSHIKMVQLFFNGDTYPEFIRYVDRLQQHYKTDNVTDTVLKCLEDAYSQHK